MDLVLSLKYTVNKLEWFCTIYTPGNGQCKKKDIYVFVHPWDGHQTCVLHTQNIINMKSMYVSATDTKGTGGNKGRVSTIPMIQLAEVILHNLFVPW